jgi:NAD(P)-dependent dehydrogenase (short-subunit alcohol dehydrogenase family)
MILFMRLLLDSRWSSPSRHCNGATQRTGRSRPQAAIATDLSGGMVRDNPDANKRVAEMTAWGRVGQPDDIGPMIALLLSEDNRWINGQRIEVSGGMAL